MTIMTAKLLPSSSILCEACGRKRRKSPGIDWCRNPIAQVESLKTINWVSLSMDAEKKNANEIIVGRQWITLTRSLLQHHKLISIMYSSSRQSVIRFGSGFVIFIDVKFQESFCHRLFLAQPWMRVDLWRITLRHRLQLNKILQNCRWFQLCIWRWFMNQLVFISGISQTECKKSSTESQTMQPRFSIYSKLFLVSRLRRLMKQ